MISFKTILKASISLALLAYLMYLAEPKKILEVLGHIWYDGGIVYLILALIIFIITLWVFSIRWQILVTGYGLKIPTHHLFKYYLIGLFFNNFLPTAIGGDVLRIYNLIKESGERTIGFASVMTERLSGITSTLILTIISIFILFKDFDNQLLLYLAFVMLAAIVIFFTLIFNHRFLEYFTKVVSPIQILRLGERIIKFLDALRFYQDDKIIYIKILLVSLLAQILIITNIYFLSLALKIDIPFTYLILVVPIIFLVTMLPSINGIGFREGGYVVLLGKIGVSKAAALSLSFISIAMPMLVSLWGGLLFMFQKKIPKKEEIEVVKKNL
jgi:uncharacterized protein (TIRG00374 family)